MSLTHPKNSSSSYVNYLRPSGIYSLACKTPLIFVTFRQRAFSVLSFLNLKYQVSFLNNTCFVNVHVVAWYNYNGQ